MQPYIGSSETIAAPYWRLFERFLPGGRVLTVRREPKEVMESIKRQGISGMDVPMMFQMLQRIDRKLDQIAERVPNAVSVPWVGLSNPVIAKAAFEHCLGVEFNLEWWAHWNKINVQIDYDAQQRYLWTHLEPLAQLSNMARHQMFVDISAREQVIRDGLEIKEETLEESFKDAIPLFQDHCMSVGEPPDEWTRNNIQTLSNMEKAGFLQVLTARANGKMFGYLVSILGLDGHDSGTERSASHTLFFASKEWPGAGLRLQRTALSLLKSKGFDTVVMRSGLGLGAKVETIYKRIGAEPDGKLFKVKLES